MRRTAGIILGLSVVGCHGLHPTRYHTVQVIPMSSSQMGFGQPAMPAGPAMLPPVNPQAAPNAGTVSHPHQPTQLPLVPQVQQAPQTMPPLQQLPHLQGEPPLAPGGGPSTMHPLDPNVIALLHARRSTGEDAESKRLQMELTKEMVAQIVQLRQKVAELSKESQPKVDVGTSKVTPSSATVADEAKPRPAPKTEASEPKSAPAMLPSSVVPASHVTPLAPPAPSGPSAEEIAARNLQMELTRELARQVIDLKQKVGDLRGDVETWAEAGREKRENAMQKEVQDLRAQIAELQSEMSRLRAPEKALDVPELPDAPKSTPSPDLSVPPPEEAAPIVPLTPTNRIKRPAVRDSVPSKDSNRRFAEALREIRADLDELKSSFIEKIARGENELAADVCDECFE